ncbi:hypothetical protein V9T40_010901 [Parthenolecanium corni]|uniref:C2H2-type domain-containing protein n=1 Tax=Parthenolecanium corni TaxID=536013 RepID=A0AAN9T6X1_9HEMI
MTESSTYNLKFVSLRSTPPPVDEYSQQLQIQNFGKMWKELEFGVSAKYRSIDPLQSDDHFLDSSAAPGGGFHCPNGCGRKYKYKGNLSQHLKNECGKEKQFECEFCNKRFTHKSTVKKHAYLLHNKIIECCDIKRIIF